MNQQIEEARHCSRHVGTVAFLWNCVEFLWMTRSIVKNLILKSQKKNIAYSILLVTHVVFKPSIPIWQECDFTLHHCPFVKHSRHPPNRETSNFLYQLCASFEVIPILWAEKIPQTYLSNSKDLRSNFQSAISCAFWVSFKGTPLL